MSGCGVKRRRNYYDKQTKRKQNILEPGLKGFLCSCNFREKECVRESYNLLNEYAEKLYGNESHESQTEGRVDAHVDVNSSSEDIEAELAKEVENLKQENKKLHASRKFQLVESGAKNFLFIRTTLDDPVNLAKSIVEDIFDSKRQKTRFLLRLVPIETTCKANIGDIKLAFEPLVEKYFIDSAKSFSIVFNRRNNNQLSKDDVIKVLADMVSAKRSDHTVNLKEPQVSVIVEIIKGIALLGVIPDYLKFKKYNLLLISGADGSKDGETEQKEVAE